MVVGEDFHFGHGRKGNVALLPRLGAVAGFEVVGVALAPRATGRGPVSSTRIRALVAGGRRGGGGRAARAGPTRSAGRWSTATAGVGPSWASRRPTWRSPTRSPCRPPASTPAGTERPDGARAPGGRSRSGRRPTFYEAGTAELLVEAYLLDFDGDLYGEPARVSFVHRLRDERPSTRSSPGGPDGPGRGPHPGAAHRPVTGRPRSALPYGLGFLPNAFSTQAPRPVGFSLWWWSDE